VKKLIVIFVMGSMMVACGSSTKKVDNGPSDVVAVQSADLISKGSDGGAIEGLQTVHFDYDKAALSTAEAKKLKSNLEWFKKNADAKMVLEGHTDQSGSAEYNLSLGERRANSVKAALEKMGVKANRLSTVSYGKEKLLVQGTSDEDNAKNRRVNFVPAK
jgi:peptidoglycan-associated lipoprotein